MLASTRAEVARLNSEIQERREACGELGEVVSEDPMFRVGDRVVFGRNDALLGVRNGDVGVVEGRLAGRGDARVLVLVGTCAIAVRPSDLNLGYVVTTHKAQGATVEEALVLARSKSDLRMTYVQASRSRGCTALVVALPRA